MKIVVNDVAATPNAGGIYSILKDFYLNVLKKDHTNTWIFILAGKFFPETSNVKIIVRNDLKKSKFKKMIFERYTGGKYINSLNPDVYISLQNIATYGVNAKKQIVYLHQPIPFEKEKNFSFFISKENKLAFYQKLVGRVIKKSLSVVQPYVIVQTKWMKKAVLSQTKLKKEKIIISHPKVNTNLDGNTYRGNGKLFFYPASDYLYKNHEIIFKAIQQLNKKKIHDFRVVFTLKESQLQFKSKNIEYVDHMPRKKVMDMYNSFVLLFPSYIESFGLPLIEAALHADIILAADTVFARELLSNYKNVYYFRYDDFQKLAELMNKVINKRIVSNNIPLSMENNGETLLKVISRLIK